MRIANKIIILIIKIMIIIIITMKIINNKAIYMKCKIDMKDMLFNKHSYELSNK